jgi:hypothetical protein
VFFKSRLGKGGGGYSTAATLSFEWANFATFHQTTDNIYVVIGGPCVTCFLLLYMILFIVDLN